MDLSEKKQNTTNIWELRHDIFGSNDSLSKAVKSKACVLQCVEGRGHWLYWSEIHHINYDLTSCKTPFTANRANWEVVRQVYGWLKLLTVVLSFSTHLPVFPSDQTRAVMKSGGGPPKYDTKMRWQNALSRQTKPRWEVAGGLVYCISNNRYQSWKVKFTGPVWSISWGKQQLMFYDRLPKHICSRAVKWLHTWINHHLEWRG